MSLSNYGILQIITDFFVKMCGFRGESHKKLVKLKEKK